MIKRLLRFLIHLTYPPKCTFCRIPLEPHTKEKVCENCRLSLQYCAGQLCCKKCGKPFPSLGEKGLCLNCLDGRSTGYRRVISVFEYDNLVRHSISAYKGDQPQRQLAKDYARYIKMMIELEYLDIPFDYIISVPPSRHRMRTKNFDHIAHLCKYLSKETGIPFLRRCLIQCGRMKKQSALSYQERMQNLVGSIKVRRRKLKFLSGTSCLLIDDICTTGSTLDECARMLKKAGAKQVYAATLATVTKGKKNLQKQEEKITHNSLH